MAHTERTEPPPPPVQRHVLRLERVLAELYPHYEPLFDFRPEHKEEIIGWAYLRWIGYIGNQPKGSRKIRDRHVVRQSMERWMRAQEKSRSQAPKTKEHWAEKLTRDLDWRFLILASLFYEGWGVSEVCALTGWPRSSVYALIDQMEKL